MNREELIEKARLAYVEAWEAKRKEIGRGIAEPGAKSRAGIVAALEVFEEAHAKPLSTSPERAKIGADSSHVEEAHAPIEAHVYRGNRSQDTCWVKVNGEMCGKPIELHAPTDEREALEQAVLDGLNAHLAQSTMGPTLIEERVSDAVWAAGFRRTEVPEPSADHHVDQHDDANPQGEPPTVQLMARKGGRTQALIDRMLAQANERGIRVEVVHPQGEPSDALAKLDEAWFAEWEKQQALGDRFGGYHAGFAAALSHCRAALRAARAAEQEGQNHG